MLLFATHDIGHPSGVHYSPQKVHPGNSKFLVTGQTVTDRDDWRHWGRYLQAPLWWDPVIQVGSNNSVEEVRRRFTTGDLVLDPSNGKVTIEN